MVPEALAAAKALAGEEGVEATVLVLSNPDRLFHEWQRARTAPLRGAPRGSSHLERLVLEHERRASRRHRRGRVEPRTLMARLGARDALRAAWRRPLRTDGASQPEVYAEYGIDPASIVTAALVALGPQRVGRGAARPRHAVTGR